MADTQFIVGVLIGVLTLIVATGSLYFQAAERYGWKPRGGGLKAVLMWLQARALFALAILSVGLLISSWVMYEWPHNPIIKTETKTERIEVRVPEPQQAETIRNLQAKLDADEALLAKNRGAPSPTTPNTHATTALPPVSGSGNAFSFGQQGGVTAGTVNLGKPDRVLDGASQAALLSMLPKGTHKIEIQSVANDYEGAKLALKIAEFLSSKGYDAKVTGVGMYAGLPPAGVIVPPKLDANGVEQITVGVNAPPQ